MLKARLVSAGFKFEKKSIRTEKYFVMTFFFSNWIKLHFSCTDSVVFT